MNIQVVVDDKVYGPIANAFVRAFVMAIVRILARRGLIDPNNANSNTVDAIFDLCFSALAAFEDHGGVSVDSNRYVAHCAFAPQPKDPDQLVLSFRRTFLHGGIDDGMIKAALDEVRGSG
ncbi:hypothetical protein [Ensifer aridi]|uniref:hypothetical protein n=1 Tax=Ensifer aridi TaxID=1708715 RepID=UPI000A0FD0D4|nr:hypothetical protein [Ensifer aridi]